MHIDPYLPDSLWQYPGNFFILQRFRLGNTDETPVLQYSFVFVVLQ